MPCAYCVLSELLIKLEATVVQYINCWPCKPVVAGLIPIFSILWDEALSHVYRPWFYALYESAVGKTLNTNTNEHTC